MNRHALENEKAEEDALGQALGQQDDSHRDTEDGNIGVHHGSIGQDDSLEEHREVAVGVEQEQEQKQEQEEEEEEEEEDSGDGREQDMEVGGVHYQIDRNLAVECGVPAQEALAGHDDVMRGKSSVAHAASSHAHADCALGCVEEI